MDPSHSVDAGCQTKNSKTNERNLLKSVKYCFYLAVQPFSYARDTTLPARDEEADAREGVATLYAHRVLGSEPLRLRTHRHSSRSRPLKSAVVEYQAPSVAV